MFSFYTAEIALAAPNVVLPAETCSSDQTGD